MYILVTLNIFSHSRSAIDRLTILSDLAIGFNSRIKKQKYKQILIPIPFKKLLSQKLVALEAHGFFDLL
jgi:hypothetical protein